MTPATPIIKSAIIVIKILYFDKTMRTGKILNRVAKLAPAPNATNTAGRAQHTKVDVDANSEKKLTVLSFMARACLQKRNHGILKICISTKFWPLDKIFFSTSDLSMNTDIS